MGEQQLQAHCRPTNPSFIWATSILSSWPPHLLPHSLLFLSSSFPPTVHASSSHSILTASFSPPRCCSKSILSLCLPLDKTEGVKGVIRLSSRGGMGLVRLLGFTHKHTIRQRGTEVKPQGVGGHFYLCVCGEGILCVHAHGGGGGGGWWGHTPFTGANFWGCHHTLMCDCFLKRLLPETTYSWEIKLKDGLL